METTRLLTSGVVVRLGGVKKGHLQPFVDHARHFCYYHHPLTTFEHIPSSLLLHLFYHCYNFIALLRSCTASYCYIPNSLRTELKVLHQRSVFGKAYKWSWAWHSNHLLSGREGGGGGAYS